jgi:Predicted membrane protein (DUF2339)
MSALIFLFAVAVIFGAVLAVEARESGADQPHRPLGLIAWLTSGNWPAKVGGGLLVVGVGALLRYALINLDVPPAIKLGSGAAAAGALGLAATLTRIGHARRAVSLALGGAAFGVAYLTAYSAFALFHYCDSEVGLVLLALTSVGAGVYAITRGALSIALLAMVGAYLAPAFAISDPGPGVVYGYLAGASVLTLVMVAARGWRPLIHLSFLFTLGGGVFFAWTAKYFSPDHANVMLPMLLVLAGLHALMPIVERRSERGVWIERLDLAFLLALPSAAALSALSIAPARDALSNELLGLAAIWFALAGYLSLVRRDGAVVHAVIGLLLAGFAVAARFHELPWELIALAFSVLALWLAARRSESERLQSALAGLVPLLGALHVLSSLLTAPGDAVFANGRFVERLIGAGLLMFAGHVCRSIRNSLDTLLWSVGVAWALIAVGSELMRWDLVSLALLVHWLFLAAAATLAFTTSRSRWISDALIMVPIGALATTAWAAVGAPASVAWVSLGVAPLVLIWLSIRRAGMDPRTRSGRMVAAVAAPVVAGLWAIRCGALADIHVPQFAMCAAVFTALVLLTLGDLAYSRCRDWLATAAEISARAFALILVAATIVSINRSPWAITLELLCTVGLGLLMLDERKESPLPRWVQPAFALAVGLILQANLLRWFGPSGDLNILDIGRMRLTALVSLVWAALGAGLTVWSGKRASRSLWMAGATLLAAAAVKFVLLDFGSLGQLGNILAVIAAGIVFLLVGWLAPMPPAAPMPGRSSPDAPRSSQEAHGASSSVPGGDAAATGARPRVTTAQPAVPNPLGQGQALSETTATADSMGEYWNRNAGRTARDRTTEPADSSPRIAWAVVVLSALILPLSQCSHVTRELIVFGLTGRTAPSVQPQTAAARAVVQPPMQINRPPSNRASPPQPVASARLADDLAIGSPVPAVPRTETECDRWARGLPTDYVVYAAGASQGYPTNLSPGVPTPRMGSFTVTVSDPERNVVLLLGAHQSAVWNIRWTPSTRIVGIWLSGFGPQVVAGLSARVPVLRTLSGAANSCPWFEVTSSNVPEASAAAMRLLRHGIDKSFIANDGRIAIGGDSNPMDEVQNNIRAINAARGGSSPPAGNAGIDALVRVGLLRPATIHDLEVWKGSPGVAQLPQIHLQRGSDVLDRTYVVQGPLTLPDGLVGPNAVTLLVPPGVPSPRGDPGQSRLISMSP